MPTSSPGAYGCCARKPRRWRDAGQLGLRGRRLRAHRRRAPLLLAPPGQERARGRSPPTIESTAIVKTKFLIGALVIAVALAYMIYAGVTQDRKSTRLN